MGKKKKKLKMHGTLHRESQGSLIYQIKRHIKKTINKPLVDFKGLFYLMNMIS